MLHGGHVYPERVTAGSDHAPLDDFQRLSRDIYIPPGKLGFWQIAFRDPSPERDAIAAVIEAGAFGVDILYGDYEGGQRVISRFGVLRNDDGAWIVSAARHWQVDRTDPR